MGISYRCDAASCTYVVWDGDVTPSEWRAHVERMFADPAFPAGSGILTDLRTAGGAPSITGNALREIGAWWTAAAPNLPPLRIAIVPNGGWDKAQQVIEEETVTPTIRWVLFNELRGAAQWLGVDADHAGAVIEELRNELRANKTGQTR